ncbi:MAG: regulatory signaling modulator protein AmpE [Gammaproteobacteria bacterium]|nr:regulatory signaling modulator protein AmpE [Gammaproteobacteria bacterium]MDH4314213.1 regulatory signaling modulator protein AmpE [Gammaproteobacteria bacterium]MDH5213244.1 regulatory signaling modulator protein AmpE [Gammaproteobacteria bacterium]MDH5499481.1 regulatory signaling modulator protein AmpE [Gammaproteobacteria bacterium]
MKLIALLIGLLIERLATQLFHLRELRWLDHLIDAGFRQVGRFGSLPALIPVVLLAAILVLPVFLVIFIAGDKLSGYPYMVLAILVLFFSLGPKDIGEEIDEYCNALQSGDADEISRSTRALTEKDPPQDSDERIRLVEEAACVQANNRVFAVIFWFVLLGPFGAWSYRVTDLMRRRAVFGESRRAGESRSNRASDAARLLHGWLAWLPARLTAIGFAMAGSFESALGAWRNVASQASLTHSEQSELLLARVGSGALALQRGDDESDVERAIRGAGAVKEMLFRLLIIWAAVIAAMTLYGFFL